jgi:hypothetical protein
MTMGDRIKMGTSQAAASASTAHMIAVIALQMIREDPELVTRLQETARKARTPFNPDRVDEKALEMSEMALTIIGQKLLRHQGPLATFQVVVPHTVNDEGLAQSAGALAVGSFTTEFVHSDPDEFEAFSAWMADKHPGSVDPREIKRSAIEGADQLLTLMAHAANVVAEAEAEPEAVHDDST